MNSLPNDSSIQSSAESQNCSTASSLQQSQNTNSSNLQQISNSSNFQQTTSGSDLQQTTSGSNFQQTTSGSDFQQTTSGSDFQQTTSGSDFQQMQNMNGSYYYGYQRPTPKRNEYTSYDTLYALLSVVLGFFISRALPVSRYSLGSLSMILVLFVFGFIFIKISGRKIKASSVVMLVTSVVFSFGIINISNSAVKSVLYLFIVSCFLCFVYTSFSHEEILGKGCISRIMKSVFSVPLSNMGNIFPALVIKDKEKKVGKIYKNIILVLLGLLCAIVPTAIVVSLLSYDSGFVSILKDMFTVSEKDVISFVGDAVWGFVIGMFVFGSLSGAKFDDKDTNNTENKTALDIIPKIIICVAVTPVLFVYVVFFVSQWEYYVSAFTKTLPENLSYAEYAREGFFQLCIVCVINAVILLVFHIFAKSNGKKYDVLKMIYSSVISLFTLVLVATALSKMLLYIDSYGLTRLRVYSSWMIILLAVFFIITLIYQFAPKLPISSVLIVVFVIFFGFITIPDVDTMIANYNVEAYISGELKTVDVETLREYGESAVPALFKLRDYIESKDNPTKADEGILGFTKFALEDIKNNNLDKNDNIWSFSIPRYKAKKLYK